MKAWINGHFVDASDAKIGFFDAGFQHGIGLFETMLARGGAVLRLEEHLLRLAASARELRLFDPLHIEPLAEAVQVTLAKNEMKDARVRVSLTAGDMGRPFAGANAAGEKPAAPQPTVAVHVQPPTRYPDELFAKGVGVSIAENRANPHDPFAGHKTSMYWPRIAAVQRAAELGCAEALWFTITNHLASGSVSNVFLAKNGALHTPRARRGVGGRVPLARAPRLHAGSCDPLGRGLRNRGRARGSHHQRRRRCGRDLPHELKLGRHARRACRAPSGGQRRAGTDRAGHAGEVAGMSQFMNQGGFRVFTIGRDAAQRFRVMPPWRVREGAGPLERALVGALTFILAIPVAVLLLALGIILLALFLGCAAVLVAFGIAMWLVRRVFGLGGARAPRRPDDGRENVRVIPPRDGGD